MVSENKTQQIKILDSRTLVTRIILAVAIITVIAFGWFAMRWQFGNMLAELTLPNEANAAEIAKLAVNLASSDPLSNWLFASTRREASMPGKFSESSGGFETVVKLAPNDFRWWIELGRTLEQTEDAAEAEKAYLRAVELAPAYTYPHWQLGNFYLRQGRGDEAFRELQKAAANNAVYRDQVFSIAWDYYEQDTAKLEQIAGDSPAVRAGLARFYASKGRAEDSLRIWNSLSDESKQQNTAFAKVIAQGLYEKRSFRQSIEFVRQLGIDPNAKAETVQNGDFESPIGEAKDTYFGWKVSSLEKVDIKLDPTQKHEGTRSLRLSFNGYSDATFFNLLQYVVVNPLTRYQLSFWIRTDNLKSGGTPVLEIFNANDDKNIANSKPFPIGKTDWQQIKMEFTTPANAEAVGIRTTRAFCGYECPIFGTFWYDDFKLEKIK
ncbi:MAG: carbohydrate binding domain-containing protein [Acidobacteria bacterium]|nr:carbohydrate binding domain-containing protein [Acidobacteriota bacterium]MCA1636990.1 carbohydrate binding domain-containing protein [Acidobacteriota bacterium]